MTSYYEQVFMAGGVIGKKERAYSVEYPFRGALKGKKKTVVS